MERRNSVLAFRIVRSPVHEYADAPHAIGLLRPRSQRQRSYTAQRHYEFAPLDMDCHATLSQGSCNGGTISRLDVLRCGISIRPNDRLGSTTGHPAMSAARPL